MRARGWASRTAAAAVAVALAVGAAGCGDDDGPAGPGGSDFEFVEGLYDLGGFSFDPQGAAEREDLLAVLEEEGVIPTLNIGLTGAFQLFYRDPVTREVEQVEGTVERHDDGIYLIFPSQSLADQFLMPKRLPLRHDAVTGDLSYAGTAAISRIRLQELFPDTYGQEPWAGPTIQGDLTVVFTLQQEDGGA